jgi:hypothetical protein
MWDNTLVAKFNPRDRTKTSWKYFNILLSGQQRRRINRNKKFLLMAHARILFCSDTPEWKLAFTRPGLGVNH